MGSRVEAGNEGFVPPLPSLKSTCKKKNALIAIVTGLAMSALAGVVLYFEPYFTGTAIAKIITVVTPMGWLGIGVAGIGIALSGLFCIWVRCRKTAQVSDPTRLLRPPIQGARDHSEVEEEEEGDEGDEGGVHSDGEGGQHDTDFGLEGDREGARVSRKSVQSKRSNKNKAGQPQGGDEAEVKRGREHEEAAAEGVEADEKERHAVHAADHEGTEPRLSGFHQDGDLPQNSLFAKDIFEPFPVLTTGAQQTPQHNRSRLSPEASSFHPTSQGHEAAPLSSDSEVPNVRVVERQRKSKSGNQASPSPSGHEGKMSSDGTPVKNRPAEHARANTPFSPSAGSQEKRSRRRRNRQDMANAESR